MGTQPLHYPVWGGWSYPVLRYVKNGASTVFATTAKTGLPQLYVELWIEEVRRQVIELASEGRRHRRAGFTLHIKVKAGKPGNADLMAWTMGALSADAIYVRPRPGQLFAAPPSPATDEWRVVFFEQPTWQYFRDRWVGHELELHFVSADPIDRPPVSNSLAGFVSVEYGADGEPTPETAHTYWNERQWPMESGGTTLEADNERDIAYWEE